MHLWLNPLPLARLADVQEPGSIRAEADAQRLLRRRVDGAHQGGRAVGADRHRGEIDRAQPLADRPEVGRIAGVSRVIAASGRSADDPAGPQTPAPVRRGAAGLTATAKRTTDLGRGGEPPTDPGPQRTVPSMRRLAPGSHDSGTTAKHARHLAAGHRGRAPCRQVCSTPVLNGGSSGLQAAQASERATTARVSAGSTIPSTQSRAAA